MPGRRCYRLARLGRTWSRAVPVILAEARVRLSPLCRERANFLADVAELGCDLRIVRDLLGSRFTVAQEQPASSSHSRRTTTEHQPRCDSAHSRVNVAFRARSRAARKGSEWQDRSRAPWNRALPGRVG